MRFGMTGVVNWQEFIDTQLLSTGCVSKAAIFSAQGQRWAASRGFEVTPQEAQFISNVFWDPSELHKGGNRLRLSQKIYYAIKTNGDFLLGRTGSHGCAVSRSRRCTVIGTYEDGAHAVGCMNVVTRVADYLRNENF
jgi:profilin